MAEACLAAGLEPVQGTEETTWHVPGEPAGHAYGSPWLPPVVASWLRSQLVAGGDMDQMLAYNRIAMRLDASAVLVGLQWQGDEAIVACCMCALGRWAEEYALQVLGIQRSTPD